MNAAETLLALIAGHFVADFGLQHDTLAIGKSSKTVDFHGIPWYYWMLGHSATHGLITGVLTQSFTIGLFETVAHFIIDHHKVSHAHITAEQDQMLHIWCKVVWIILAHNFGALL